MDERERLEQCERMRLRVLRGDAILGLVSLPEVEHMIAMYRELGEAGVANAWLGLGQYHLDPSGLHGSVVEAAECACRAVALRSLEGARLLGRVLPALRGMKLAEPPSAARARDALVQMLRNDDTGLAHHVLGLLTIHGVGGAKDRAASAKYQTIAAERGYADAQFEISVLLATGTGVAKDAAAALRYCMQAAEQGQARACYNLGAWHATGHGVPLDEEKAREWYQRASDAGHGQATATLAIMTMTGSGCEVDPVRAEELFELSQDQGFDVPAFRKQFGM